MIENFPLSSLLLLAVFIISYTIILFEHVTKINKAAAALVGGTVLWAMFYGFSEFPTEEKTRILGEHIFEISQVVFFLIGAMAIVEVIDVHQGFRLLTDRISTSSKVSLLWIISLAAFFLSAVLDNLTTTIIMVTLLGKLLDRKTDRWMFGGIVVIAANAGGAWTPIGDVTTTMLWIGGHLSTGSLMQNLFLPSLATLLTCVIVMSFYFKNQVRERPAVKSGDDFRPPFYKRVTILCFAVLMMVPILKGLLGLPPFLSVFIGLSIVWVVTDILHRSDTEKGEFKTCKALMRVDFTSVMFFLGILLAVSALGSAGLLKSIAVGLGEYFPYPSMLAFILGVVSSLLDNVPLVAAVMGMYDFSQYAPNHAFWEMIAFCAGTGGSITLIGSAAGVAFMGIENVSFTWYLKRITPIALLSYIVGYLVYLLQNSLLT